MRFSIQHSLTYRYSQPVQLTPHWVRLRPRCDLTQRLVEFALQVAPEPSQRTDCLDLDGNNLTRLSFQGPTDQLILTATSRVETLRNNPFDFLLELWATEFPVDYPASLQGQLQPYLKDNPLAAEAVQIAEDLSVEAQGNVVTFLTKLNQLLYQECSYQMREMGSPWPAGVTWRKRSGSCRDVAVLFMEVCRTVGLAVRFVSGYQKGDPEFEQRYLHAWVEVYLPGAGWRGFDPTHGLAVADDHVALVATPYPASAAPVQGGFQGSGVTSEMEYELRIRVEEGERE